MAIISGNPGDETLQGTTADDTYIKLGIGNDIVKDPGGKNTIDISSATTGAIVDLSPGKTSTLGTGTFTLGSLIVGNNPDVVFVADVSGSTSSQATGVSVGDLNGDGLSNTILDAEIAGYIALNQSLIDRGLGSTARVSLVSFSDGATQVGATVNPTTDANNNGVYDIVESLKSLQYGGGTNYEAGLQKAQSVFQTLNTPSGKGNLVFLSDGVPNDTTSYLDEVSALKTSGYNLKAFGVGSGSSLPPLQLIDPNAQTFTTTDELVKAFSLSGGSGTSTETAIQDFIGTNFADKISGNALSNNINAGAGDDIIAGVNPNATNPGKGEIDTLTGGTGKDTFVLGDGTKVYYDDGDTTKPGVTDYALITDFNLTQGDTVKLAGSLSNYTLGTSPIAGITGQAIFLNKPTGEPSELIAILKGSSGLTLDQITGTAPQLPTISIAPGINASEDGQKGSFKLTRTGGDLTKDLTVTLDLSPTPSGTAKSGEDYKPLTATTVTFKAGQTDYNLEVTPIDDKKVEGTETIVVGLKAGNGYTLDANKKTAKIDLLDNDKFPTVTIAKGSDASEDCKGTGTFVLTRTGDLSTALTVSLDTPTGTASNGTDYKTLPTTVTFAAGKNTATIKVDPKDDKLVEGTETITLGLKAGNGYELSTDPTKKTATINLFDNDKPKPIYGDWKDNTLTGGAFDDTIYGKGGKDTITGKAGNDKLYGDEGDDKLFGGLGNDKLYGGKGGDVLDGVADSPLVLPVLSGKLPGQGQKDSLKGDEGRDTFVLGSKPGATGSKYYVGGGDADYALIQDFTLGKNGDKIQLFGSSTDYSLKNNITVDGHMGIGIYTKDATGKDDLVGLVETPQWSHLSLDLTKTSQFTFVS